MRNANFANLKSNFSEKNVKCSSKVFPVSSASLPMLELANIWLFTNHFSLALLLIKLILDELNANEKVEALGSCLGRPREFSHPSEAPHLCFVLLEGCVSLNCSEGKTFICYKGRLAVFGQISDLGGAGIWRFTFCTAWAQPHGNLYRVYL